MMVCLGFWGIIWLVWLWCVEGLMFGGELGFDFGEWVCEMVCIFKDGSRCGICLMCGV